MNIICASKLYLYDQIANNISESKASKFYILANNGFNYPQEIRFIFVSGQTKPVKSSCCFN